MTPIIVEITINDPIEKIWKYWTEPEHITKWTFASDVWCAPRATNDLKVGGKFNTRMEAKDGSVGFDFEGTYTNIIPLERIEYEFGGRTAKIEFVKQYDGYKITETFDPEDENPIEMQRSGWQAILENFKKYVSKN